MRTLFEQSQANKKRVHYITHGQPTTTWGLQVTHRQGFHALGLQIFPFIHGEVIYSAEMYVITFRDM